MAELLVPVSIGEILDKISILQIKEIKIKSPEKLANIKKELNCLTAVCDQNDISYQDDLFAELKSVNQKLWEIEDRIRVKEKAKDFDESFVELARAVYVTNDGRFDAKSKINSKYGSALREEKSYEDYS